nr:ORF2 [Torque teno felis virus]
MQKPLPGPNLMLPALRLSDTPNLDSDLAYKKREAKWKQLISKTHKEWCLCGSYLNHFLSSNEPLRSCSKEGEEDIIGVTGEEEDVMVLDVGGEEEFQRGLQGPKRLDNGYRGDIDM